jgi:large subunit ribosomal protein L15
MPLYRRVPKFGFKNINRKEYRGINLRDLQNLADKKNITEINIDVLIENGMASKNDLVKILGAGELTAKIEVSAHGFTKTAQAAIETQGGTATKI